MSIHRLVIAHVLILFVVAGSVYDIGTRQEHWPFSNYPMFSSVHRESSLSWLRLFGVTADEREIALLSYDDLWPLDQSRLPLGLRRISESDRGQRRLEAAISDVLTRYNARRASGQIDGPALRAVRLYRVKWTLEPFAANLDNPDSRELLAQANATGTSPLEARQ